MTLLNELNPAQQEAVETVTGPVLALAGPGSGKTRALTYRIAHLIQAYDIAPWHIIAVTFTNKAAREMTTRLAQMLTPAQVQSLNVGTFHALCARLLRREIETLGYYDRNFIIYDTGDQQAVIKQALRDLDIDEKQWKPRSLNYAISKAKNEMMTPQKLPVRTYQEEIVARVYERYQQLLIESNALDFNDLLLVTHHLLHHHPPTQEKYQQQYHHVMVDEFQDTNMVQYELAKILAGGHRNIFVVGDLDQGVYSWRGADYRNVLRFRDDYPDHKLIHLPQNYRSTQTILAAAKEVIRKNKNRIENDLFTERSQGPKIRIVEAYNEYEEAAFVTEEIRRLQQTGEITPGGAAIMYRTNAQSRILEEAFVNRSMPYLLVRGTRFYERREIKDMLAYLRLIHNPEDIVSLLRIINVPSRGIGAKTLSGLQQWAFQVNLTPWQAIQRLVAAADTDQEPEELAAIPFGSRGRKALLQFGRLMNMLIGAQAKLTLPELYDLVLARTGYKNHIKDSTPESEERLENLAELKNVTQQQSDRPAAESMADFLEHVALVSDVDALAEEGQATALLTLHTAKGLEFPVVFIVGLEEGLFPHSRSLDSPEELEEERRLAYVGITRAKDRLYLTRAFRRQTYGQEEATAASRFLRDIPPELIDTTGQSSRSPSATARQVNQRWQQPTAAPTFKPGDQVRHTKFGLGTIITVEGSGDNAIIQVAFPGQGVKKLAASIAPLKKQG